MSPPPSRSLLVARRAASVFGALTAVAFVLIVFGALVRAKGAGLACPDWPLCFGAAIPSFDFRIALEWGHRVLAGALSVGLAAASAYVLREPGLRPVVGAALGVAWVLLAVQIVLGGLTVLLGLAPWTVTAHLLCGSAFCATLLWCARNLAEHGSQAPVAPLSAWARALGLGTAALVAVQVGLGGWVSSHFAGLACYAFPTCDGVSIAPTFSGLIGIHLLHRLGACLVGVAFILLVWATRGSDEPVARIARSGLRLVVLQLAVGIANVLLRLPPEVTALHSALAAALVLASTLLAREILLHSAERSVSASPARAQALGTS